MLNIDVNLSIRKVQNDLSTLGIKRFTKIGYLSTYLNTVPSDLLSRPNSIIDAKASTGTRATWTTAFTGDNNDLVFTAREPGTSMNSYTVSFAGGSALAIATTSTGITITVVSTVTLVSAVKAAIEANTEAMKYLSVAYATGNTGAGTITITEGIGIEPTTSGTGTGWYNADEVSIEDYNRLSNNTYLTPSATSPVFVRMGDSSGTQIIEFLPITVTFAKIHYYYQLADLTADTDTIPLPIEYEELFLMDLMTKTYATLKQIAESQTKAVEYETKMKELEAKYINQLQAVTSDKIRMQSNDITS